jgi:hypothetical protein
MRSGRSESFYRGPNFNESSRDRGDRDFDRGDREFDRGDRDRGDQDRRDRDRSQSWGWDRDGEFRHRDFDFADRIRSNFGGVNRRDLPFRYGWWDKYGWGGSPNFSPWRYSRWRDRPYYWWGWSSPLGLTNWLVYGFDRPRYWWYGRGENIWYDGDYVYYDGERQMPADDYYDLVDDIARDVPKIDDAAAEQMDWKPLGVFAVRRENETESDRTLQIAVNRDGVLVGTYFIPNKKEARPITGRVDKRTARAAWTFADTNGKSDIIFETSIYNLTQPTANMMVHFGPKPSDAEVWQLVRLETPEGDAGSQGSSR